jgi:hypothetical protein
VEISVSFDNKNYKVIAMQNLGVPEKAQPVSLKNLTYNLKKAQAQFIHIKAKNIGTLPAWHRNAGQSFAGALMYFDEIIVR